MRSDVDGARDELLARAAFARDEHREVVPLQALDLLDHPRHRRAGAQESRQERLEGMIDRQADGLGRAVAGGAQRKTLLGDGRNHADALDNRLSEWPARRNQREASAVLVASERLHQQRAEAVSLTVQRRTGERAGLDRIATPAGDDQDVLTWLLNEERRAVGA